MTHLKKSLALLLAIIMIFSSMSVAASAADGIGAAATGESVSFTVKFFRYDGTKWIETTKAAPGEAVKARVYAETSFGANAMTVGLMFDEDFFDHKKFTDKERVNLEVNSSYMAEGTGGLVNFNPGRATGIWCAAGWPDKFVPGNVYPNNLNKNYPNGIFVDEGIVDASYLEGKHVITGNIWPYIGNVVKYSYGNPPEGQTLDPNNWVIEYDLEVKNDATALDARGEAEIPVELRRNIETYKRGLPALVVDISKGTVGGANYEVNELGNGWEISNAESIPGVLTTTGKILLNANGGSFGGDAVEEVKGTINTSAYEEIGAASVNLKAESQTLLGWSTLDVAKDDEITEEILAEIGFSGMTASEIEALGWEVTDTLTGFIPGATAGTALTADMITSLDLVNKTATQLNGYGLTVTRGILEALKIDTATHTFGYEDTTLYAMWDYSGEGSYKVETYLISREDAGKLLDKDESNDPVLSPTYVDTYSYEANKEVPLQAPTRLGFTFLPSVSTSSVVVKADGSSVLKAYYARNIYEVNYHYEEGSENRVEEFSVPYDAAIPEFSAVPGGIPQKDGYTFVGWALNEDGTGKVPTNMPVIYREDGKPVLFNEDGSLVDESEDIILNLYPVYTLDTYLLAFDATDIARFPNGQRTVSLALNYGDVVTVKSTADGTQVLDAEGKVLLTVENPAVDDGTSFIGWDIFTDETLTEEITITDNVLIVAVYNVEDYTVTFLDEDGEEIGSVEGYLYGDILEKVDTPEGYKDNAWRLPNGDLATFPLEITGNITLKADKDSNIHDAVFDANGGKWADTSAVKNVPTLYGEEIVAPEADPEKTGYDFLGWSSDKAATKADDSLGEMDTVEGKTFYAVYAPKNITLTFESDGTPVAPITQPYGSELDAPESTKEGYVLTGWINKEDKTPLPDTVPSAPATYIPVWKALSYNVIYKNGAELVGEVTKAETDSTVTVIDTVPVKTGYKLDGWKNDADNKVYTKGQTFEMPAKDVTLTAQWTATPYVIALDTNGGAFANGDTTFSKDDVIYDEPLKDIVPADPAWATDEKVFAGWADADDATDTIIYKPGELQEETMPEDGLNLKAVWTDVIEPEYKVTFLANGGKFIINGEEKESVEQYYKTGEKIVPPAYPVKDGFNCQWYPTVEDEMGEENLTYMATWTAKEGDIDLTVKVFIETLDAEGNPVVTPAPDVVYEDYGIEGQTVKIYDDTDPSVTVPETTYAIPYTSLTNSAGNIPNPEHENRVLEITLSKPTETENNNVLVAYFKLAERKVTFVPNGGTFADGTTMPLIGLHGAALTEPEINRPGYTFKGWMNEDGEIVEVSKTFIADETYEAVWEKIVYGLVFDGQGGEPEAEGGNYAPGDKIVLPAISKDGYRFDGWADSEGNDVGVAGEIYIMPDNASTLVAQWTKVYTATYVGGLDGKTEIVSFELAEGEKIPAIAQSDIPTVDGYRFTGWTGAPADGLMDAEDVTIKAEYAELFTLSYEYTQDVGAPDLPAGGEYIADEIVTLPAYGTFEGYKLEGWYDESDDKVSNSFKMPDKDTTLYVKVSEYFTLSFKTDGGSAIKSVELTADDEFILSVATQKTGHTFKHWVDEAGTVYYFNDPIFISGDTELTAVWEKITTKPTTTEPETETTVRPTFVVSFEYDKGKPENAPELKELEIMEGNGKPLPPLPVLEGYEFDGWYDKDGNKFVPGNLYRPTGDTTFTVKWSKVEEPTTAESTTKAIFTISLDYEDGTPEGAPELPKNIEVEDGGTYKLPALPTLEGYEFDGWYDENGVRYPAGYNYVVKGNVTLTAKWAEEVTEPTTTEPTTVIVTYKLSFDYYDGEAPAGAPVLDKNIEIKDGGTYKLPALPTLEGYEFDGWFDENNVRYPVGYDFRVTSDTTLKAKYTEIIPDPVKYTLTFNTNGGSTVKSEELLEGAKINLPVTTLEGSTFDGWLTPDGEVIPAGGEFAMPAKDVTLIAQWTAIPVVKYDVSYDYIGDNVPANAPTPPEGTKAAKGEMVTVAPVPSDIEGYTFQGWYVNGVKYDGTPGKTEFEMIGDDIVIEGYWIPVAAEEYIVTYKYEGDVPATAANIPGPASYEKDENVTVSSVPAAVEGYDFDGWYWYIGGVKYNSAETKTFDMPANNVEIVGTWSVHVNDIILNADGGKFDDLSEQKTVDNVEFGEKLDTSKFEIPEKEGYSFTGWKDAEGNHYKVGDEFTMPDGDVELTAEWKINEYTITFDSQNGTTPVTKTYEYGEAIDRPADPTREGFIFTGWSPEIPDKMPANNVTVVAQWKAEQGVQTYTITFDTDGGSAVTPNPQYYKAGETVIRPANPTKEGFIFVDWSPALPEKMPAENITVKAIWEKEVPEVKSHTVTYYLVKGEDGVAEEYTTKIFKEGEPMTHPTVELEGFTFNGWTDENGDPLTDGEPMGTEDFNAYAKLKFNSYRVTYLYDESGVIYKEYPEVIFASDVPNPDDPTKAGYIFAGWEPAVEDTMPAHDLTYTAKWVPVSVVGDKYTARFVVDGRTHDLYVLEEGDAIPTPATPKKFGHVFVGWEPEVPATMPGKDVEFVAQWEVDKTFIGLVVGGVVVSGVVVGSIVGANVAWITGASIVGGIIVIVGAAHLIKNTHTVTYMVDGEVYKVYKVVEGTKIPVPADPAKDGSKFTGWNPEVPEKMGETDLVFEATWKDVAAADDDIAIPDTGSAAGVVAFAVISGAAAAAYVITARKKKED